MTRPRGGANRSRGQQSHYGGFNQYNQNENSSNVPGGQHRTNHDGSIRKNTRRNRSRGNRGSRSGYDENRGEGNNYTRNYSWNQFAGDGDENKSREMNFKKFRDHKFSPQRNPDSMFHNSSHMWYDDSLGDYSNGPNPSPSRSRNSFSMETSAPPAATPPPQNSVVNTNESTIVKEQPKLNMKIKTECSSPKGKIEPLPIESLQACEKIKPPPTKKRKKMNKNKNTTDPPLQTSQGKVLTAIVKEIPAALPTPQAPPAPSSSSSTTTSDDSSSSEEEVIPDMPLPVKVKKERSSQPDVVCLGKQSNMQNLVEDDDSDDSQACIVCNKKDHSSTECRTECKRCSHRAYEMQVVCKNCGETYKEGLQSMPKPPNFFEMFMQFMQFCASQNHNVGPFAQFTNTSFPAQGLAKTVEASRKDSANGSKQSKKRRRNSNTSKKNGVDDSEEDLPAKTSTSKHKRKKSDKSTPPNTKLQHHLNSFSTNMQFPAHFAAPGFNPMFAFNPLMGYNPAALNFTP